MMMRDLPTVLGIETSCDETGVAVVRGGRIAADVVATSSDQHALFGGVVPEIASRAHVEVLPGAVRAACERSGVGLRDLDAVAVAAGPGLKGALLAGASAARGLAIGLGIPIFALNHLAAHASVDEIEYGSLGEPAVTLLVSGGHTNLLLVRDPVRLIVPLGRTLDDAAGEAFDKIARLLGLPYPGGPSIDRAARDGDANAIAFPRGLTGPGDREGHRFDFSFSGLKTAVARWVQAREATGAGVPIADVAASFQEAVVDVLVAKAIDACQASGSRHLVLGGGVAANSRLRQALSVRGSEAGINLRIPRPALCTDNGAMIAWLGARVMHAGVESSGLEFECRSQVEPSEVVLR